MSAVAVMRAYREGMAAATLDQPPRSPYDPESEDAVTRAQALMWVRGYDKIRPAPVDYSG